MFTLSKHIAFLLHSSVAVFPKMTRGTGNCSLVLFLAGCASHSSLEIICSVPLSFTLGYEWYFKGFPAVWELALGSWKLMMMTTVIQITDNTNTQRVTIVSGNAIS